MTNFNPDRDFGGYFIGACMAIAALYLFGRIFLPAAQILFELFL